MNTFNMTYTKYINWIEDAIKNQYTWNKIMYGGGENDEDLEEFLEKQRLHNFWNINKDEWKEIVKKKQEINESSKVVIISDPRDTEKKEVPDDGCFKAYLEKLRNNKFSEESINAIESSALDIMSHLKPSTTYNDPFRGLVVGNVQSGKTSNMAALIALAADYGYNFFIVLSGTIENLRVQTEQRLYSDLNFEQTTLSFELLTNLSAKSTNYDLSGLYLSDTSKRRYLTVCLKNSKRLSDLLKWLNKDTKSKAKLKILIIDDEADQAGINTANIDKKLVTKINDCIKKIVFATSPKGGTTSFPYQCMNYMAYTATPYANVLNEASSNSLYPKNMIATLSCPNEYFGPQQIFGSENSDYDGMSIINTIPLEEVTSIAKDLSFNLPKSLSDAIMWFVCSVAFFRHYKLMKPVSMLIHTSPSTKKHEVMGENIKKYFSKLAKDKKALEKIEKVYDEQVKKFNKKELRTQYDDYGRADEEINDFPKFDELKGTIKYLLETNLKSIMLDEDGAIEFSNGIHLCIDNSVVNPSVENEHLRLVYPKANEITSPGPAFIVIGGSTLSRGLTLEGLTTTYFLRTSQMADTLMQMGRWFGYRRNYEVLQRLWLSEKTIKQFEFLSQFDEELRFELEDMSLQGLKPSEYAPRLKRFPKYASLTITSKKKMQKSIQVEGDFLEYKGQTTTMYSDESIIKDNLDKTIEFLNNLGDDNTNEYNNSLNESSSSLVWLDVDYEKIFNYIKSLSYPENNSIVKDMDVIEKWFENNYKQNEVEDFNIVLVGLKNKFKNSIEIGKRTLNLISRSIFVPTDNFMRFGTITDPKAKKLDIDEDVLVGCTINKNYKVVRGNEKYRKKPILTIYIIDKDSEVDPKSKSKYGDKRIGLNTQNHVVGYELYIPKGDRDDSKLSAGKIAVTLEFDLESGDIIEN